MLGGIDLDPASNAEANRVVRAEVFFSSADDGLGKSWEGRVWLNPPYSPEKGLMTIALAREGERRARRARDIEGLRKAGKIKMQAQAEYVCWRDDVAKVPHAGPGRGKKNHVAASRRCFPDGDPGDKVAHRWRKHLCVKGDNGRTRIDPQKLETAVDEAALRSLRAFEMDGSAASQLIQQSLSNEHFTPPVNRDVLAPALGPDDGRR